MRIDKLDIITEHITDADIYSREEDKIIIKEPHLMDAIVMSCIDGAFTNIIPNLISFSYIRIENYWFAITVIKDFGKATTINLEDPDDPNIIIGIYELIQGLKYANDKYGFIHNRLSAHNILCVSSNKILIQDFRDSLFKYKDTTICGIDTPNTGNNDLCKLLYEIYTPEYFRTATDYKADFISALYAYTYDELISQLYRQVIYERIRSSPPITTTVFRGQKSHILYDSDWYTTSKREIIARNFIHSAYKQSTIFIIHLIDVPAIDVNEILLEEAGYLTPPNLKEDEILILGGGTFYSNPELTHKGFKEIKTTTPYIFETWYTYT